MNIKIEPLLLQDLTKFLEFTDKNIGRNYFSKNQAQSYLTWGQGVSFKAILPPQNELVAVRLTFRPGAWLKAFENNQLSPHLWNSLPEKTAYFKSLFVAHNYQKRGLGSELTQKSLQALKKLGTTTVVTHCWKESPNNSSWSYLTKTGFKPLKEHPYFWSKIDYQCTRCGAPPCQCTAIEMILQLP